jgi:branched-chain amino acid transport system substrate-binding protein
MKLRNLSGVALVALLVAAACQPGAASPTPAPATDAPATDAPATDAPATDAPGEVPTDELGVVAIPAGEPIHIAFWGVLSGPDSTLGTDSQRGVEIAIDDRGGMLLGREIELTSEDGLCTPEGGANAATKMAADSTIVGLIGSTCSDETVGGIQSLTDAGMTTISPANTRPTLTVPERGPEYAGYLRTAHSDAIQGVAAADFAYNELGLTTAATVHDGSAYAEALQGVFADHFTSLGGTVTLQTAVSKGQTDMVPVLTTIASSNDGAAPEIVFAPLFVAEMGFMVNQSANVPGLEDAVLMGADAAFSPDFIRAAGPPAENMYLSSPDFTAFGPGYADFLAKHEAKYGGDVLSIFHAHAYDATNIMLNAIEEVAVEVDGTLYVPRGALREAIYATSGHEGIIGTLSCDENGDCSAPVIAVYQVTARETGGEWPPEAPIYRYGQ